MVNELYIAGRPIPLKRPRFNGKFVFDSQAAQKKDLIKALAGLHLLDGLETGNPLRLILEFAYQYPKSISKAKQREFDQQNFKPRFAVPDLDNLIKWVCDLLNGHIWKDDSQICVIEASKFYDTESYTYLKWEEI